jgi:hypothetical protein
MSREVSLAGTWHEMGIERRMVAAELRGRLGLNGRPENPDWSPRSCGNGRLENGPGGIPIVHLEGTPEERGEQRGRLLGAESRTLVRVYVASFLGPQGTVMYVSSLLRYRAVERFARAEGPIGLERAVEALRASAPRFANVQSMVFLPREGAVHVTLGAPPAAAHRFVRLGRDVLLQTTQ